MTTIFKLDNLRVKGMEDLPKPKHIKSSLPLSIDSEVHVIDSRQTIANILNGHDKRFIVITGPCSIHDTTAALEYAHELVKIQQLYKDKLFIVMRLYFEKPRTQVGWKGFINDPHLDGSYRIYEGLFKARELLLQVNKLGLPVATEWLDTITPQYIADLVSLGMIGARTTESQVHRQLVSGMSMPVGFKNSMSGSIQVACDAIKVAEHEQSFLGTNDAGDITLVHTRGNPDTFVVLRGSNNGTNYDEISIAHTIGLQNKNNIRPAVIVDCSHGNSQKNHNNQEKVVKSIINQLIDGNHHIKGLMLESNINEGNQKLGDGRNLKYGISITDACINLDKTRELIENLYQRIRS